MTDGQTLSRIAGVVFGVIGAVIGLAVVNPSWHIGGGTSVEKALADGVNRYNAMLPMMVDNETRLETVEPRAAKTVVYHYTLVKRTKASLVNFSAIVKMMRPRIINMIKTTEATKAMMDLGVTFVADYYDRNGVFVGEIKIEPSDLN